jgi:hypothetical protein
MFGSQCNIIRHGVISGLQVFGAAISYEPSRMPITADHPEWEDRTDDREFAEIGAGQ